jgi:glutamate--cysteine ligase
MHSSAGEQKLTETVDAVLKKVARKYREYGIQDKPYVVIKADAGTYAMGVLAVRNVADVAALTESERNQLLQLKEGLTVRDLIVQEGVYTVERIDEAVAEMVVYMINRYVIGGFYRAHPQLGPDQIFNAPDMRFAPLTFERAALPQVYGKSGMTPPNRFYLYGVVARLALLAAASELEKTDPHAI